VTGTEAPQITWEPPHDQVLFLRERPLPWVSDLVGNRFGYVGSHDLQMLEGVQAAMRGVK
jgi:hypothetical protein